MKHEPHMNRTIDGRAYVSGNGQLVIDRHASDQEHLLASQTRSAQPLYDCRTYADKLFPEEWLGVPGRYDVHYVVGAGGAVSGMMVVFTPQGTAPSA